MRLWLDPAKLAAPQHHRRRRRQRAARAERAGRRRRARRCAGARRPDVPDQRARDGPAHRGDASSRTSSSRPASDGALVRVQRRRPRRARRRDLLVEPALRRPRSRRASAFSCCRSANALEVFQGVMAEMDAPRAELPARARMAARVRQRRRRPRVDHRGAEDAGRGDRPRHPRDVPVPAELAQHDHPGDHDSGLAHRHVRVHQAVRLLDQHADALRHRARHRHRRRRCDRRDREHRAPHARVRARAARQAAIDAMREVFGAVVVIGIVLVAVFVPVAFFPGTTGRLYQQFSLTIAFAVVLSVFNAVTLTPALCGAAARQAEHTRTAGSSPAVNRVDRRRHARLRRASCAARCSGGW